MSLNFIYYAIIKDNIILNNFGSHDLQYLDSLILFNYVNCIRRMLIFFTKFLIYN